MTSNKLANKLTGYADEVLVEVGGLLYRLDSVERVNRRFILHTVDDLKETREMLRAVAEAAGKRSPQDPNRETKR